MRLEILSGGAAEGLVGALTPQFMAATGCDAGGSFGAVGAMRDKLLGGTRADLLILTRALIGELEGAGHVVPGSAIDIGIVRTSVAVRAGDPAPAIGNATDLRAALLATDAIYFPDPGLATAGIHFAKVLAALGIDAAVAPRLRTFPNGTTAMAALALAGGERPIGCTQTTEILNTPGVVLAGPLPREHELATIYTAGVCTRAALPNEARRLAALLSGDAARALRARIGFEPIA